MAIPEYQESSGAVIFHHTPDELEIIKLKEKIRKLESKMAKLESLVEELVKAESSE